MAAALDSDHARLDSEVRVFHRYTALAVVPAAVFLAVLMHPTLLVLGGDAFNVDILVGALIVAGLLIDQWNGLAHYILATFERTVFLQNTWLVCGGLNVALNLAAVPLFGLRGAAAVTLISFVVLEATIFRAASHHVNLRRQYSFGTTARAAVAAAVGGGLCALVISLAGDGFATLAGATAAFWVSYMVGVIALRELRRQDFHVLMRTFGLRRRLVQG